MLKQFLARFDGTPLLTALGLNDKPVLIVEGFRTIACHWSTGINDAAETTTVVEANPGESLLLTDIIVTSSKKVASSTITIRFSDGTNTENMMVIDGSEDVVEFNHSFLGGVRGWKDADLQVVTNQAAMYAITFVGYLHISPESTKSYGVWNAER